MFLSWKLSCTASYGFLAVCQNLEETNNSIPEGLKDGWTDHGTLPVTARGPINNDPLSRITSNHNLINFTQFFNTILAVL